MALPGNCLRQNGGRQSDNYGPSDYMVHVNIVSTKPKDENFTSLPGESIFIGIVLASSVVRTHGRLNSSNCIFPF